MSWKDRLKPDNKAEAGFYRFVFVIVLIGFFALLSKITENLPSPGRIALEILVWGGIMVAVALLMASKLRASFLVSRLQSVWSSLISVAVTFLLFFISLVVLGIVINVLGTFLPNRLVETIWAVAFFILIFSFYKAAQLLQTWLVGSLLGISKEETNDI